MLRGYSIFVQLVALNTTDAGLKVRPDLDEDKYIKAVKVSDARLAAVNLRNRRLIGRKARNRAAASRSASIHLRQFGLTGTVMSERQQADHDATSLLLALLCQQCREGPSIGAARKQLIAIDQIEHSAIGFLRSA